jgi:HEAT repeat protein
VGILQSKHLKVIAGMTVITFLAVQFVDYQFKSVTREQFQHDELAQFYGYYTIITGIIAATAQFAIASRLLEQFGVVAALLVLPVSLLCGNAWVALAGGGLWAVTFTQGAQASFRYSVYDATMQVIYTPVPSSVRGRAKGFIDGILKPIAIAASGLLMWLLGNKLGFSVAAMAWVEIVLLAVWIGLVLSIKREYVRELIATLRKRRLNFDQRATFISDAPTLAFLKRTLATADAANLRNALELLPRVQGESFVSELTALIKHPEADIRATAVSLLGHSGGLGCADTVCACFADPNDEVRAAAIRAYCFLGRERAIPTVTPFLGSDNASVRAAAVAGLITHGSLDGILRAAEPLKHMLEHADPVVRAHGASVLAEIRVRNFYQPVLALMRDSSTRVQLAAIAAAGEMQSPELIPALLYRLAHRETAHAALRALYRYGDSILELCAKVLGHTNEDLAIRRHIPRILSAMRSRAALDVLLGFLDVEDPALRREVARAAVRVRDHLGTALVPREPVEKRISGEVRDAFQLIAAIADLGTRPDRPSLLHDALEERVHAAKDRIFRMLAIVYPSRTVELVFGNLSSPSANVRANAVEILDNMLSNNVKRVLLPLVEDTTMDTRLRAGMQLFGLERKNGEAWLGELMLAGDPWLRVCAVHEAGERRLPALVDVVAGRMADPDPVVRETAARAASQLMSRERWLSTLAALQGEHVEWVRRYAESLARTASGRASAPVT